MLWSMEPGTSTSTRTLRRRAAISASRIRASITKYGLVMWIERRAEFTASRNVVYIAKLPAAGELLTTCA